MSLRPRTPTNDPSASGAAAIVPPGASGSKSLKKLGVDPASANAKDFATDGAPAGAVDLTSTSGNPTETSPLGQSMAQSQGRLGRFDEDFDAVRPQSSVYGDGSGLQRSASNASATALGTPSRSGTLKKRGSVSRRGSLKKSSSRRSLRAGSIKGVAMQSDEKLSDSYNSAFFTPIPTSGSPTEVLANRFQAWRKLLKDLVTYFREVQTSYEARSKALLKVSNVVNNTNAPPIFLTEGGINDANRILRDYHKQAMGEANKAREIEQEVIAQLSGLRTDLNQKIKEIKSLSGDFKNSVEKEKDGTRKAVTSLEDALAVVDAEPESAVGKGDPFVVRLGVDRQLERQIDEENYLHRAYLNLEGSGRELESIVVGEIQKAYNALASILKRDADESYSTIEKLKSGPIGMPKDREWSHFVEHDSHIVNPNLPLRRVTEIDYPGKHHPAAAEVRAGMLERKSKYLKSYTPGWYVLSPTHLHEFKSADRLYSQPPVMSLYLKDQKLGSHSQPNSSSHKFILKGRQTGSMHRGHSWVFRAESFDTMFAWYEEIRTLTEKSGEERNAYVRKHARSMSNSSQNAPSITSSVDLDEDEADAIPYSGVQSYDDDVGRSPEQSEKPQRPSPGGRFPSDLQVQRHLQAPTALSSASSEDPDLGGVYGKGGEAVGNESLYLDGQQAEVAAAAYAAEGVDQSRNTSSTRQRAGSSYGDMGPPPAPVIVDPKTEKHTTYGQQYATTDENYVASPETQLPAAATGPSQIQQQQPNKSILSRALASHPPSSPPERHNSLYGEWMAPAAAGVTGAAVGTEAYRQYHKNDSPDPANPMATSPIAAGPSDVAATGPLRENSVALDGAAATTTSAIPAPTPLPVTAPNPHDSLAISSPRSVATTLSDETDPGERTVFGASSERPGASRADTETVLAQMHVPGEYPKSTTSRQSTLSTATTAAGGPANAGPLTPGGVKEASAMEEGGVVL